MKIALADYVDLLFQTSDFYDWAFIIYILCYFLYRTIVSYYFYKLYVFRQLALLAILVFVTILSYVLANYKEIDRLID